MKENEITIGKKVYYHPIIGGPEMKSAEITSGVYEICGTKCCKIDIIAGVVDIASLSPRE